MNKFYILFLFFISLIYCNCDSNSPTDTQNNPPIISEILNNPVNPIAGESVTLNAIATDKDGDSLLYNWSSTGGEFSNSGIGNPINWEAPYSEENFTITCIVSDGKDTATKSKTLTPYFSFGKIIGYVYDKSTNNPIDNVRISINDRAAHSRNTGYYELTQVEIGEQVIWAEKYGYTTYSDTIFVNGGENFYNIYF